MRSLAKIGSTRAVERKAISASLAAINASAAVTAVVIIVLVIATDPAAAPASPAPFPIHPERDMAISPTLWMA